MNTRAQRRRRRRRILTAVAVIVILAIGACVGALGWYQTQLRAADGSHGQIIVTIPKGSSTSDIARQLQQEAVITNATAFGWHVRLTHAGPFEAGRYSLRRHLSADEVIDVLTAGPLGPQITTVTFPEGFRLGQIATRLHDRVGRFTVEDFNAALASGRIHAPLLPTGSTNYEGMLFPATYAVTSTQSLDSVLQKMADTMSDRVAGLNPDTDVVRLGLSSYELVVVASLVQAEAGNPDEAPKIARVIYNRLAAGQPLGIDATSRYLSIISGQPVDFESSSPYNTRRRPGLPPTPIGAPGDFALQAAAHPAVGNWLYYVRDVHNDAQGRPQHVFTDSASEFEKAKQACYRAGLGCGPS